MLGCIAKVKHSIDTVQNDYDYFLQYIFYALGILLTAAPPSATSIHKSIFINNADLALRRAAK